MGQIVFNVAKGMVGYYATLPASADSIIAVLIKSSGLEADSVLKDYDNLSVILAASNDECDFTNYSRKALTSVSRNVDDTNDWAIIDADDPQWVSAGGATNNTIGKILFCYKPDTASADTAIIPLTAQDVSLTTDGSTIVAQLNPTGPSGFHKAA